MAAAFGVRFENREIVGSGSVVVSIKQDLIFQIADLTVRVYFENSEDKKTSVLGDLTGPKELRLKFCNFNSSLGTSYSNKVGSLENRVLYGAFYVHSLGETGEEVQLLNYTFTVGETAETLSPPVREG